MTKNLDKWLSIIANFSVVAGIIFLAVEVRQNQASLSESNIINSLDSSEAALVYNNNFREFLIENPDALRVWRMGSNGDDMPIDDSLIFNYLCANWVWNWVMAHERYDALGRETQALAMVGNVVRRARNQPGIGECWEGMRSVVLYTGYAKFVELADEIDT